MDVEGILLAPANIVVNVRRVSTQSIVVCLQDKELAKNALVARQVSIVQIAETTMVVLLKLDSVIRVLGVPRVSIEVGAQMALQELVNTVQTANTRVLMGQKPVHHVLRFLHQRVNTFIWTVATQWVVLNQAFTIVTAIHTALVVWYINAPVVEHVQAVDIEADVVWDPIHLTVQAHVNIVLQARTKRAGAHSLTVTFACATEGFKSLLVDVQVESHVGFALLASTSHLTVPRSDALTVNHVQKVNLCPAVLGQTALVPAWDVQQEHTRIRWAHNRVQPVHSAHKASF